MLPPLYNSLELKIIVIKLHVKSLLDI